MRRHLGLVVIFLHFYFYFFVIWSGINGADLMVRHIMKDNALSETVQERVVVDVV